MNEGVDPFDLNDPRLEEQLGTFGAVLRDGAQVLDVLSQLPSLDDAAGVLRGLDEPGLKSVALASLLIYKMQHSSEGDFRAWVGSDPA